MDNDKRDQGTCDSETEEEYFKKPLDEQVREDLATGRAVHYARRPVIDDRSADEIIGYDDDGLPR